MERSRKGVVMRWHQWTQPPSAMVIVFAVLNFAASASFGWSSRSDIPLFEEVHQQAIERVLRSALGSDSLVAVLQLEQTIVDKDQDVPQSYEHAMTGVAKQQSYIEQLPLYIARSNQFVAAHLKAAMQLRATAGSQHLENSLHELGKALHPLEDATSPSHEGFQAWSEGESAWQKAKHVLQENAYPDSADGAVADHQRRRLEGVVAWAYDIYTGALEFPPAFFNAAGQLLLPARYVRP